VELDPRRLLILRQVARHGGVAGAAKVLNVSVSAVSQQLQTLERAVGVSLFDRSERSIKLTPAGELLLTAADQIDDALDQAGAELGRRQVEVEGVVTIGSFQSAIVSLISPALNRLHVQHPRLHVQVREVSDSQLVRMIVSGELDLGTAEVRLDVKRSRGLAEVPVLDDPWLVVAPSAWRVRTMAQLHARPWISADDDARADALQRLSTDYQFQPFVAHRCVEYPSVLALVAAGAGAAVVPSLALKLFGSTSVRQVPAPGIGARTITLVHRVSRKEPTAAVRAVIEAIQMLP
jgi:DNA-binding transcriptional LysR family regulator